MTVNNIWGIESIEDLQVPEIFMENAKMGIARIQVEILKVRELKRINDTLDKLLVVMAPTNSKPIKIEGEKK